MGGGLLKNTLVLTASNLIMRLIGLLFQIYVSKMIGAEGIGVYFLILSVNITAATFAISGGRFAATRIVSEELGKNNFGGAFKAVNKCIIYSLCFGLAALVLMFSFSRQIGCLIIGDKRTVLALRCLSVGLPFISVGAVISGYFTAVKRAYKGAGCDLFEQLSRMAATIILLKIFEPTDAELSCAVLVLGSVFGEILSCLLSILLLVNEKKEIL